MEKINILSLFDGMSCGQMAINRSGIPYNNYYASEIDKWAIGITQKNYPNTIQLGDVTKIDQLPTDIDLLIGGSPCTNLSFAGNMKGFSTKDQIEVLTLNQYLDLKNKGFQFEGQSYLFWEYVRILNELKPKYFLLENVMMSKKWKDIISEILGVQPIMIDSRLVSAQKRRRLYWTNIEGVSQPDDKGIKLNDILLNWEDRTDFTYPTEKRIKYVERKIEKGWIKKMWNTRETDKAECLMASSYKHLQEFILEDNGKLRFFHINEFERLQTVPDNYTSGISNTQRIKMLGNGWTVDVISHILSHINKIKN